MSVTDQPLLPTEADSLENETPYDVGHRHGFTGHNHTTVNIPRKHRSDYSRGFARGVLLRVRKNREEVA